MATTTSTAHALLPNPAALALNCLIPRDVYQVSTTAASAACPLCSMVRERKVGGLSDWVEAARQSGVAELRTFAAGLMVDRAAVEAALLLAWSNGQTKGQVNRLKFLKRQMYGRASFDLLRAREVPSR